MTADSLVPLTVLEPEAPVLALAGDGAGEYRVGGARMLRGAAATVVITVGRLKRRRGGQDCFVDEVSETVQLARTSRRFFDPPDRDQAVEDVDDELGRGARLRTRLVSRRSAPCAYQVTDAQRWLGPPVSRCLR
ncbi:hypothetical protein [Streptomyces sp. NPDC007856]|uniref:hypothetical protein n=1 Tax=Streptomyces sp. NPDC007856 TaxID=3364781 RepID=UPI0036792020